MKPYYETLHCMRDLFHDKVSRVGNREMKLLIETGLILCGAKSKQGRNGSLSHRHCLEIWARLEKPPSGPLR